MVLACQRSCHGWLAGWVAGWVAATWADTCRVRRLGTHVVRNRILSPDATWRYDCDAAVEVADQAGLGCAVRHKVPRDVLARTVCSPAPAQARGAGEAECGLREAGLCQAERVVGLAEPVLVATSICR